MKEGITEIESRESWRIYFAKHQESYRFTRLWYTMASRWYWLARLPHRFHYFFLWPDSRRPLLGTLVSNKKGACTSAGSSVYSSFRVVFTATIDDSVLDRNEAVEKAWREWPLAWNKSKLPAQRTAKRERSSQRRKSGIALSKLHLLLFLWFFCRLAARTNAPRSFQG